MAKSSSTEKVSGFRSHYGKTLDDLIQEELKHSTIYSATRQAKNRLRMYANLFNRDMRKVLINDAAVCCLCQSKNKLQIDHITPLANGGKNEVSNVQILCSKCNRSKSNY